MASFYLLVSFKLDVVNPLKIEINILIYFSERNDGHPFHVSYANFIINRIGFQNVWRKESSSRNSMKILFTIRADTQQSTKTEHKRSVTKNNDFYLIRVITVIFTVVRVSKL